MGERDATGLLPLFAAAHERIRGVPPRRPPRLRWYSYVDTKSTIRERDGRLHVRISDHLQDAPDPVLSALFQYLVCSLDGRPQTLVDADAMAQYEAYVYDEKVTTRRRDSRRGRGRKHIDPIGDHRSLLSSFLRVMDEMQLRLPEPPILSWSKTDSRRRFGHWDSDHRCIVISRALDDERVPRFVLDYVVYHELLHILHPVDYTGGAGKRRRVHTKAFLADEAKYPRQAEAERWLGRLAAGRLRRRRLIT